jgi:DNA polymerase-1
VKYILVDFFALFHRSRAALLRSKPSGFSSKDGIPTTGVFSTLKALFGIFRRNPDHKVIICSDLHGGNRRRVIDSGYKANREKREDSFYEEAETTLRLLEYLFPLVRKQEFEADDIIASLVESMSLGDEVLIISCDKDLLYNVSPRVTVELFTSTKKWIRYTPDIVKEEFGIRDPKHIALVKALAGDSSDNIPGLRRVGNKTAARVIAESNCLEFAREREDGGAEKFLRNLSLILPRPAGVILPSDPYPANIESFQSELAKLGISPLW